MELHWSVEYIEASFPSYLKQEWMDFYSDIPYWYYGVQRCGEIRMGYLLDAGEFYKYEWMDAQTKIVQRIMTTDVDDKSKIYVQALGLLFKKTHLSILVMCSLLETFNWKTLISLRSSTMFRICSISF